MNPQMTIKFPSTIQLCTWTDVMNSHRGQLQLYQRMELECRDQYEASYHHGNVEQSNPLHWTQMEIGSHLKDGIHEICVSHSNTTISVTSSKVFCFSLTSVAVYLLCGRKMSQHNVRASELSISLLHAEWNKCKVIFVWSFIIILNFTFFQMAFF